MSLSEGVERQRHSFDGLEGCRCFQLAHEKSVITLQLIQADGAADDAHLLDVIPH